MKLDDVIGLGIFCSLPTAGVIYAVYRAWKKKHHPPPKTTPYKEIVAHLEALGAEAFPTSRMIGDTPTHLRLRRPEGDIRFLTTWSQKSGFGEISIGRKIQASDDPNALEFLPMIRFRPETSMDRVGKLLGINREVQTLDSSFDAGVYVESDSAWRLTERIMAEPKVRDAAQRLIATQPTIFGLRLHRDAVYGQWTRRSDIWRSPERLRAAIADIDQIAENLPPIRDTSMRTHFAFGEGIWILGILVSIIFWPISFVLSRRWPLLGDSLTSLNLNTALLLTAISIIGIWFFVRGRPQGLRILTSGAVSWFLAFWALTGTATQTYNALDDPGTEQAVVRKVDRRYFTSTNGLRRGRKNYLYFYGARDSLKNPVSLRVSRQAWDNASPGTICVLEYKPGRLNKPWLTRLLIDAPESSE
jgi:hypothetical protein